MKRTLRLSLGDEDGSRSKRRKDNAGGSVDDVDVVADEYAYGQQHRVQQSYASVREQGMRLWQTIRDATNKDGFPIAGDFVRKPPKKVYPDYYQLIQHPIALEDIKKQLESNIYPTLEAVRQDFELCFENAMQYNVEDSHIWKFAKDLLKLTNKTYRKMVPSVEEGDPTGKQPSLHKLAKSRLRKVIEKTDDYGRVLSAMFMELPSKKEWPQYYLTIAQPRCLEAIHRKVKDKTYSTMSEFADEVELVFGNAMSFNQEHTQIWEDALALKNYFGKLMSDLPPPFTMERYRKTSTKIKIKMPTAVSGPAPNEATTSSVKLRVPAAKAATPVVASAPLPSPTPPPPPVAPKQKKEKEKRPASPALPLNTLPSTNSILPLNTLPSTNSILPSKPAVHRPAPTPAPAPIPQSLPPLPAPLPLPHQQPQLPYAPNIAFPQYNTNYGLPAPLPVMPLPPPAPVVAQPQPPPVVNPAPSKSTSLASSPAPPPILPSHMLRGVSVVTEPGKRPFLLDYRDGVKTWVIRLGAGENALSVADVTYMGDPEDESSDEEVDIEEDHPMEEDHVAVNGNGKKPNTRGREGKSRAAAAQAAKAIQDAKAAKKAAKEIGEVQVKLNGLVIAEADTAGSGKWMVAIPKGSNIVEVGEKDGLIWKVYAERVAV
ncbi:RSC complex protein [Mycena chlorophos]|uniref:RSC complex protein n=1 Tax=Mycena chlorophos TaxID=658473 RepID=A0A8H6SPQ2_MYCCL|nr:RSC complex protein [Mycena chlorophos]